MLEPTVSLTLKAESGYEFSESESKVLRVAGTSGKAIFSGTLVWDIVDSEWSTFTTWWESISKGVDAFDLSFCTGAVSRTHSCQAVSVYTIVRDTGVRRVSLPVVVLDRPTGLASGWDSTIYGPPAAFPSALAPMPQWGFNQEEAALFLATNGVASASRPVATRGVGLKLSWQALSGAAFDVLVAWWGDTLATGRRKFTITLPGEGSFLCRLQADPSFTVDGADFKASMDIVATRERMLPPLSVGYLYDTWQSSPQDYLSDSFEGVAADKLYNKVGA